MRPLDRSGPLHYPGRVSPTSSPPEPPYDIIGDVHGCDDELAVLLERLGYEDGRTPAGRHAVFLGDLVDRGPQCVEAARRVMAMVEAGAATCLLGNHEHQLLEHLAGRFPCAYGLEETLAQFAEHPPEVLERFLSFVRTLPLQLALDGGRLVVAHAGMPEEWQGSEAPEARQFALYGSPVDTRRREWASSYAGRALVVYGHTPTPDPEWINGTLCIDTGCVYGGSLSALRYPERELVSVPARRRHYAGV